MTAGTANIKVRKVNFNVQDINKYYVNGNIFGSHFINSMHIVFPEGEKFFIRSVRRYMDEVKDDPELIDRIKKFIGQEGVHNKEHEKFWDILENMGVPAYKYANFYSKTAYQYFEKGLFGLLGQKRGNVFALSVTTALEHFTALLGEGLLQKSPFYDLPEDVSMLLKWHAAEELEHKSVCYDVYEKVSGDYATRVAGMVTASGLLWLYIIGGQMYFVATDKDKKWTTLPIDFVKFISAVGGSKSIRSVAKMYFDYYKRDFHPDQHDNYGLASKFFEDNKAYFQKMGVEA
jgi:predicted metal-dependent hydrolase